MGKCGKRWFLGILLKCWFSRNSGFWIQGRYPILDVLGLGFRDPTVFMPCFQGSPILHALFSWSTVMQDGDSGSPEGSRTQYWVPGLVLGLLSSGSALLGTGHPGSGSGSGHPDGGNRIEAGSSCSDVRSSCWGDSPYEESESILDVDYTAANSYGLGWKSICHYKVKGKNRSIQKLMIIN